MSERKSIRMPKADSAFPKVVRLGQAVSPLDDLYHYFLTRSWVQFFSLVAVVYLLTNALFAVGYLLDEGSITSARPGSFEDAFFFSVQTMATIGYGSMAPATRIANILVTLEAITGMLGVALVTGITFAKFARPTARVLFSDKVVLSRRNGVPHLMFRMANWRHNQILEAQLRVILLLTETTREGEVLRLPVELPLVRNRTALFSLSWMAMHVVDEKSPFHDGGLARLQQSDAQMFLSLTGLDETFAQSVHARKTYNLTDIIPDVRFADVLKMLPDGTRVLDYTRFHDVVPLDEG